MYQSLTRLKNLPDDTLVFCGHEYTQANLRFANMIEPNNPILLKRIKEVDMLRENHLPTVPAPLKVEKETNPFLRCDQTIIKNRIENHFKIRFNNEVELFQYLREWKNKL